MNSTDTGIRRPWYVRALSGLVAVFMFAMVAVMFFDVIARYGLGRSIEGGFEIIGFLLGLLIFSGFPLVTYEQSHISVGLLDHLFRGRAEWWRDLAILIASAAATAFIANRMWSEASLLNNDRQVGQVLDIQIAPFVFVMAGLAFVAFILLLVVIWNFLRAGYGGKPRS